MVGWHINMFITIMGVVIQGHFYDIQDQYFNTVGDFGEQRIDI
jgi:hypothetical protein